MKEGRREKEERKEGRKKERKKERQGKAKRNQINTTNKHRSQHHADA